MLLRRAALLAVLAFGTFTASASAAPQPRIVNGGLADQGEYPAQGYLGIDTPAGSFQCGGTLVGRRQFLTAAHCVVDDSSHEYPASDFYVYLGDADLGGDNPQDGFFGVTAVDANDLYDSSTSRFDVAMLTLDRDAPETRMRVVKPTEGTLWDPGTVATIIGWGTTCSPSCSSSQQLREAQVPIVADSTCVSQYAVDGLVIDPQTMVCAGDDPANSPPYHDTCQGDSGGPLLVPSGPGFALAGVVSFGIGCADPDFPGVYSRIGGSLLNTWVHDRLYQVDLASNPATSQAGTPATVTASTLLHPDGPGGFSSYDWDFDGNGSYETAGGGAPSISHTFPSPGSYNVGVRASDAGGYSAERHRVLSVGATSTTTQPTTTTTATSAAPVAHPIVTPTLRLASLIIGRTAPVDRLGRFGIRINFDAFAPAGKNAVITVKKGSVKIGSAKVKVSRGNSVRAKVKLTKSGLRRLKKARKLKVTVRLVLDSTVQTKTVTLKSP